MAPTPTSTAPCVTEYRLEGAPNFRDLGGLPVAGGRIRPGRLFRSDRLSSLTERDLALLGELDLRLVCDVRSAGERERHPNRLPDGHRAEAMLLDISADLRGDQMLIDILSDDPTAAGARRMMIETYRRLPAAFAPCLGRLVARLCAGDCLPAVIHCTAGKDRTGFVVAMLLLALGASRETVFSDYILTDRRQDTPAREGSVARLIALRLGFPTEPEVARAIVTVCEEYLETALATIAGRYGGVDAYLSQAGIDDAHRRRLAELLVE
jgi:protein-tyrosine phosphatase